MGLWEAGQIYFIPSIRQFLFVDSTYVIWFLAPLVDLALFVLLGAILGAVAGPLSREGGRIEEAALSGSTVWLVAGSRGLLAAT